MLFEISAERFKSYHYLGLDASSCGTMLSSRIFVACLAIGREERVDVYKSWMVRVTYVESTVNATAIASANSLSVIP